MPIRASIYLSKSMFGGVLAGSPLKGTRSTGPHLAEMGQILRELTGADLLVKLASATRDNRSLCEANFHSFEPC